MITSPTVLVLGAGASQPYGFPTGWGLTQNIIRNLHAPESQLYRILTEECRFEVDRIRHFRDALDNSFTHSVDAFLEHRTDHLQVGKAAIAASLIPCEDANKFSRKYDMQGMDRRWYSYLFGQMGSRPDHFKENRISIITFNYDRSFEYALFTMLLNRYQGISVDETRELYFSIPIVHVHGVLGFPDFMQGDFETRPYEADVSQRNINIATRYMKIVSEVTDRTPEFAVAFDLLSRAHTICFVGFGYNIVNMSRLQLNKLPNDKRFIGTAHNLGMDDYHFAYKYLHAIAPNRLGIHLEHDAEWVMQNAGLFSDPSDD